MKVSQVIEELVEERSLDYQVLSDIICEGLLAAYKKRYPYVNFNIIHDNKTDEISILAEKKVVLAAQDEDAEIGIRKARAFKKDAEVDELLWVPFEGPIGRIEILKAKQVIAQKIRYIEAVAIYNEFKPKEGSIVVGTIHKSERDGVVVKVEDALAFLPKSLMIPGDKCVVGYTVRALLKEVLLEPRNDNQLILDRSGSDFLTELFKLEIPEIFEKIVEIKKIARIAGYKSKILVISHDKNIDPVGTCIGFAGARIKPILRELGVEKVDIMSEQGSREEFVAEALKPAQINRIAIEGSDAKVWLAPDQRSLAIGKMGQNIRLASELTGLAIHLMQSDSSGGGDLLQSNEDEQAVNWEL